MVGDGGDGDEVTVFRGEGVAGSPTKSGVYPLLLVSRDSVGPCVHGRPWPSWSKRVTVPKKV